MLRGAESTRTRRQRADPWRRASVTIDAVLEMGGWGLPKANECPRPAAVGDSRARAWYVSGQEIEERPRHDARGGAQHGVVALLLHAQVENGLGHVDVFHFG